MTPAEKSSRTIPVPLECGTEVERSPVTRTWSACRLRPGVGVLLLKWSGGLRGYRLLESLFGVNRKVAHILGSVPITVRHKAGLKVPKSLLFIGAVGMTPGRVIVLRM